MLATAPSCRWHSLLTPLRLMLSEWASNPEQSCSGLPWWVGVAGLCGPLWLAGGIRSVPLVLLCLFLHPVWRDNGLLSSGAFDRLRDSQRRGEEVVARTLVIGFSLFGRGCPPVPVALRLREAVIVPRTRMLRMPHHEPLSVSVGRGWRLGFVSLERVSSPP